ncbi:sigma-70 family RNA polymerase sigma factor [Niallia sp. Sow4_A1]|uniref:Sigma-70 family RNA polymerase sigma factor n=1 Tax=Niallia hominis TaxID=3133173 RepID=A0ABV1F4L1_9BACI|nr:MULTISPECIES: sigma-70 family RNA polymerase sigma factor [Bacillaceae]MCM3363434.1 sigma-70 family RNA polymerase sigma factor [Niallia sp. MER TA 168]CAI9395156.1 RNA polymerase sigma factor SigI [Bacillus sp. T2.9-1]
MEGKTYDQLVEEFTPMINHMMKKLTIYKDKQDFFQIGLISIWETTKTFNPEKGKYSNYLYRHMWGRFLDELKRRTREAERNAYPSEEFWEVMESPILYREEEDYVKGLCKELSEGETTWVVDTFVHQLTVKEIAQKERVSPSAVKWWRKGAKEKLKRTLVPERGE